jgi:uncharacterized membrane protein YfcA
MIVGAVVSLAAGYVQGLTGFGFGLAFGPTMLWFAPPRIVVAAVIAIVAAAVVIVAVLVTHRPVS